MGSVQGQYDYAAVLENSLLFYEAQRSGPLPPEQRVEWRGDSALDDSPPGGYYDAGDFVKFGFPMAGAMTQIAWGGVTFQAGFEAAGQMDYLKSTLKWGTDYFIACHSGATEFTGQVGDGNADHAEWGRPEDMTMYRPSFTIDSSRPGSDLAGETAAALAASSLIYRNMGDEALADEALSHARELFDFANNYREVYSNSIPEAAGFYNSWSGYGDELAWAAAWLAKVTGESTYLTQAESLFDEGGLCTYVPTGFDWDNKIAGTYVLMYELTGDSKYESCIDDWVNHIFYEVPYSPKGMIYVDQWGTLRHAANVAHVCAQLTAVGLYESECDTFVKNQINYALGDGGRSYVVGMGDNPPCRPHHRSSSCPDMPEPCDWDEFNNPNCNYQTLFGALVGGPDQNDNYNDDRGDYVSNEVACDYNGGFTSALAYLVNA